MRRSEGKRSEGARLDEHSEMREGSQVGNWNKRGAEEEDCTGVSAPVGFQ